MVDMYEKLKSDYPILKDIDDMSDMYFTSLIILQKMHQSEYNESIIPELAYLLDKKSFINLIWYYGGKTITIPSKHELLETFKLIKLYHYVVLKGEPLKDSVTKVYGKDEYDSVIINRKLKDLDKILKEHTLPKSLKQE